MMYWNLGSFDDVFDVVTCTITANKHTTTITTATITKLTVV